MAMLHPYHDRPSFQQHMAPETKTTPPACSSNTLPYFHYQSSSQSSQSTYKKHFPDVHFKPLPNDVYILPVFSCLPDQLNVTFLCSYINSLRAVKQPIPSLPIFCQYLLVFYTYLLPISVLLLHLIPTRLLYLPQVKVYVCSFSHPPTHTHTSCDWHHLKYSMEEKIILFSKKNNVHIT